jgi:hypothetical protein
VTDSVNGPIFLGLGRDSGDPDQPNRPVAAGPAEMAKSGFFSVVAQPAQLSRKMQLNARKAEREGQMLDRNLKVYVIRMLASM